MTKNSQVKAEAEVNPGLGDLAWEHTWARWAGKRTLGQRFLFSAGDQSRIRDALAQLGIGRIVVATTAND